MSNQQVTSEEPVRAWAVLASPVGDLRLRTDGVALTAVEFTPWGGQLAESDRDLRHPVLAASCDQLREYFAGERQRFDLRVDPAGSDFSRRVWRALADIPYGQTRSYGQVAAALGLAPAAARAVGGANGRNPVPVVLPCHRVVGADGSLTGYAGGVERKRVLLALETTALC